MTSQPLINHLERHFLLSPEEKQYLQEHLVIKEFQKDEIILKQGETSKAFFFIVEGCIRLYYLVEGEEKTAFFYTENQFVSSYESFVKQMPAKHNLACLENSLLIIITIQNSEYLLSKFPKFEALARIMMEEELITYQKVISTFIAMSPEERYLNLLECHPNLIKRIPQYHLASYIGVKPESLSRIRKRVHSQRKT